MTAIGSVYEHILPTEQQSGKTRPYWKLCKKEHTYD